MNQINKLSLLALLVTAINATYYSELLVPAPVCPRVNEAIKCQEMSVRYRNFDGTCNNIKYPWWGAAGTPYNRILDPMSSHYSKLPTAYEAVNILTPVDSVVAPVEGRPNHFFSFFAYFVGQDLSSTIAYNEPPVLACPCGTTKPECYNIPLSYKDQNELRRECLNYVRSVDAHKAFDCALENEEQLSKTTHYLDLSNLYGASAAQNKNFRLFKDGKLKTGLSEAKSISPPILNINECLDPNERTVGCFYGPDERAFIQPSLTSVYTLFIREHNRIASELKARNPSWSDNILFEETRRIVIAIYQNMIFQEFLPIVIGQEKMDQFFLYPLETGYLNLYNEQLYPNVFNEFATATFKLANYVPDKIEVYGKELEFADTLWKQGQTYKYLDDYVRSLVEQTSLGGGFRMSDSLLKKLAESPEISEEQGGSLPAVDVQQSRDHSINSYAAYRDLYGCLANEFSDLADNVDRRIIDSLKSVYRNVEDIDLFVGLLAEDKLPGAAVGNTAAYIIGRQFTLATFGDRYYYENGEDKENRFPLAQLDSIRAYKTSKFLCNNVANEAEVDFTLNGFLVESYSNSQIPCSDLPDIDFDLWKARSDHY